MSPTRATALSTSALIFTFLTLAAGSAQADVSSAWRLSPDGLGPLRIGATVADVTNRIDRGFAPTTLEGDEPAPGQCFSGEIGSRRRGVAVLGTGFRVAVIFVSRRGIATAGGVRVGDSLAVLRRAYGHRLVPERNAYDPDEVDYDVRQGNRKLRFFLREGRISGMTAGRRPEVDYIEGCA